MCLVYNKKDTEKFWKTKNRKGKDWCWAYKLYRISGGELFPPYGYASDDALTYGEIVSDRRSKEAGKYNGDDCHLNVSDSVITLDARYFLYINRGIHVITRSQNVAKCRKMINRDLSINDLIPLKLRLVRVKCYKEDFVAADGDGNAVFMKIILPQEEFDRVIKKDEGAEYSHA